MTNIVIGTTPKITYKFSQIIPSDISIAIITIKKNGKIVLKKDLSKATIDEDAITWQLTQEETLSIGTGVAEVMLNWIDAQDVRGVSEKEMIMFVRNHIDDVITSDDIIIDLPNIEPLSVTENGTYRPQAGIDGFNPVIVNIQPYVPVIEGIEISENGEYTVPEGVDGYNPIFVNTPVPNIQSKVVDASPNQQIIIPDEGYDYLSSVTVGGYGDREYSINDIASGVEPSGDITINSESVSRYSFFENKFITSVYSERTKYIYGAAFQGCTLLKSINFKGVLTISSDAFRTPSLIKADLPSATDIGWSVFEGDTSLSEVNIPSAVSLGSFTFKSCTSLKTICLPSIRNIGSSCFSGCTSLTDIYLSGSEGSYSGAPWGAPGTCTIHYNTIFDENGEPTI